MSRDEGILLCIFNLLFSMTEVYYEWHIFICRSEIFVQKSKKGKYPGTMLHALRCEKVLFMRAVPCEID